MTETQRKRRTLIIGLAFLTPLLIATLLINRFYFSARSADRMPIPPQCRILILGDSHVSFGIDPAIIGPAVNFSSYGESYIQNFYKLKYALTVGRSIRTVILPIDLHSFSSFRLERIGFNPHWAAYIDYLELGRIKGRFPEYLVKTIDLRLWAYRGQYGRLLPFLFPSDRRPKAIRPDIERGFTPKTGFFFRKKQGRSWNRVRRQLLGFNHFHPQLVLFFRRILSLCAERDIRVVLVKMPITSRYYRHAARLVPVDDFYGRIERIAGEYPGVHRLNYQAIYFKLENWLFFDAEHLNNRGARHLSDLLRKNLIQLGLLPSPG